MQQRLSPVAAAAALDDTTSSSSSSSSSSLQWRSTKARGLATAGLIVLLFFVNLSLDHFGHHHHRHQQQHRQQQKTETTVSPGRRHLLAACSLKPQAPLCRAKKQLASLSLNDKNNAATAGGRHFLLGYGSLVNRKSRHMTHPTGGAVPVVLKGYKRTWSYAQPERKMTAVGAVKRAGAQLNGVMVKVSPRALPKFDAREKRYTRTLVPHENVQIYPRGHGVNFSLQPNDKVWIYLVDTPVRPSKELPIAQSYVDVIMSGCLHFGRNFAIQCARETGRWTNKRQPTARVWINDRQKPRIYDRDFVSADTRAKIDELFQQIMPDVYKNRKM